MSYLEGLAPLQTYVTPETRKAARLAARRAGLTMNQAGAEAWSGWLEWQAHVELEASRKIVREHAEDGVMISA
jgi:hypothetical protein